MIKTSKDDVKIRVSFINKNPLELTRDQETVTISKDEYERLKKKAEIADDALVQFKLGLEDLRHGRVSKFELEAA